MGANNSRRYQIETGGEQIARLIDDIQMENERLLYEQDKEEERNHRIQSRNVTRAQMEDPRYTEYLYRDSNQEDADRERIRKEFRNNILADTIRIGVDILTQLDDENYDDLEEMFSQLLRDMADDLERLDYSGSELNETVEFTGKTILVIARSNEENIQNFRRNFRNMNQLFDYLPPF
tara:strand:- start:155 stop:688 length:534 start_codon:yes stop_codon:yes gene_type:complete